MMIGDHDAARFGAVAFEGELSELDARAIAARYGGLAEYARAVHNLIIEPYQLAWAEALETEDRVAIICPPDTYKSTTVQLVVEQSTGRNPDLRTLWLMNTKDQAQKRVMAIKQTIEENAVYQRAFGTRPNKLAKWTTSELFLERSYVSADPTIMATGFLGAYQGLHFDRIIIDDPTDQDDVRSPQTMQAQRDRLRGVLTDRLVESGQIVAIFTRWAKHDLLPEFRAMGFRIVRMPIIGAYPWGPTISNKRFPMARVEALRRDKGDVLFTLTYMCDTSALSGVLIKREHLRWWDASMVPEVGMPVFMYVDPAASEKTSADFSSIHTVGYDYKRRRVLELDHWMGRVEVPVLREEIIKRAQRTAGLVAVGVETVGFQLSLMQDLRRQAQLPLVEVPYRTRRTVQSKALGLDKDKTSKALYLDSLFTSDRLYLAPNLRTELFDGVSRETMLMHYGSTGNTYHDDYCDSLAGAAVLAESMVRPDLEVEIRR
ncbi:MAG TPA: hypothetical protein VNI83_02195 [Vicinamibacterales bacterium]|nr:hypothetical protein [Vicinamibacterales bacterium]